ncbi:MAG: CFI-box-CTERM domain-containing protein [Dehalococcoidia bacterium]
MVKGIINSKYKVSGLLVALVGLLVFVPIAGAAGAVTPEPQGEAIEVNPRHPVGEVVEIPPQGEIIEIRESEVRREYEAEFWFVDDPVRGFLTSFVGGFALSRNLTEYLQYYDFDPDGVPRVGVTSRGFVEEFQELEPDFTIRFEIIDPDEVRHLQEAAREIGEKHYVLGASYSYMRGRITVDLTAPNHQRWEDIYQEYEDLPLRFYLLGDPLPESAGKCFIATAVYGTTMAGEIQVLREFRDKYLLIDSPGRAFVDFYYSVSPPIAEFITEHPSLKPIVRAGLLPAVVMSTVVINTSILRSEVAQ